MKGGICLIMKADDFVKEVEFEDDDDEEGKEVTRGYTNFELIKKEVEYLKQGINLIIRALNDNDIKIKETIPPFLDEEVTAAMELENKD